MKTHNGLYRRIACALSSVCLATGLLAQMEPAPSQAPGAGASQTESKLSHHDRSFLKSAAKAGMKEVAISQAVMAQLSNPQAKLLAQAMITAHSAANAELAALAARKGFELPKEDADIASDWARKIDVDGKYIKEMVSDHEEAVKLFEKGAKSDDPDIAAFAQKALPTLQHHLMMAEDLKKSL